MRPFCPCGSEELVNTSQVKNIFQLQQEAMKYQEEVVRLVTTGLEKFEMPKREFLSFDGDPKKYPRLIKSLETNVERRVMEDDERLSFLIQYCERSC